MTDRPVGVTIKGSWTSECHYYEQGDVVVHHDETWIATQRQYYWAEPGTASGPAWFRFEAPA